MSTVAVRDAVIQVLTDIQAYSGRALPQVADMTCPLTDLPGFDSLNAVEAASMLSARLGCDIGGEIMLPRSRERPPTIGQITKRLSQLISDKGDETNG